MHNNLGVSKQDLNGVIRLAIQEGNETIWAQIGPAESPAEGIRSRDLFTYLLALFEGKDHTLAQERVGSLMAKALSMQVQGDDGLWNFEWVTTSPGITDPNAVEFCMRGAVLLWRHKDKLPAQDLETLKLMMNRSADTCYASDIPLKYSNIALMNIMNLILLGEALDRSEIADEGYRRLDQFCVYTWEWGIHEFTSPTYTGIQAYCIMFALELCQRKRAKIQLEGLMMLLLTLISLDRGASNNPVMGANSRKVEFYTTPYRSLDNSLNYMLWAIDWWPDGIDVPPEMYLLYAALAADWLTRAEFFPALANQYTVSNKYPRDVQYSWGADERQSKIHWVSSDVSLSCAGAGYDYPNNQDMPLVVDFPWLNQAGQFHAIDRKIAPDNFRAYFVPQFNGDPFGETGSHHFAPFFWAGTQKKQDALGVAFYNNTTHNDLKSYFVLPADIDQVWIGDRLVFPRAKDAPVTEKFEKGDVLVFQTKDMVTNNQPKSVYVGVKIVWMQSWGKGEGVAELDFSGEAIQLTILHEAPQMINEAGVAFWVRVVGSVATADEGDVWRTQFQRAKIDTAQVVLGENKIQNFEFAVEGLEETLHVAGVRIYEDSFTTHVVPGMSYDILNVNGKSEGAILFEQIEPVATYLKSQADLKPVVVLDQPVYWHASDGFVTPPLEVVDETQVWLPVFLGSDENDVGSMTWRLHIEDEGPFYLWGCATTPALEKPPFVVRLFSKSYDHPRHRLSWFANPDLSDAWCPLTRYDTGKPEPITLPKGDVFIQVFIRTSGVQLGQLCLSSDVDFRPVSG